MSCCDTDEPHKRLKLGPVTDGPPEQTRQPVKEGGTDTRSYLMRARCRTLLCVHVLICMHVSYVHAASTTAGNTCF